jgi:hypothetical protein
LGGIHTTGFFGLLAIPRQFPLLPLTLAVGRLSFTQSIFFKVMFIREIANV